MMQIGPEHALDCCRRIFRLDVMVDFAPDARVGAKAAADVNVISFDRIALLRHRYPGAKQADVADIMLRAGIGAAGEMDVHGRIELHTRLAPPRNLLRVALGVEESKPAAGISGAGYEAGANRGCLG